MIPKFASEAEEADWWDRNQDWIADQFQDAAEKGELKVLTRERLMERIKRSKEHHEKAAVSIDLAKSDVEIAQRQAAERGIPYEVYVAALVHEALQQKQGGP